MIAVVIPSYRVKEKIMSVLSRIGPEVSIVYVIDDACPEGTGRYVQENIIDPRVNVFFNPYNLGVGAAVKVGYRQALKDGVRIVVKLDGDGQMDPALIPGVVRTIQQGKTDYSKGNRFFELRFLSTMPKLRLMGNSLLSFANKLSSGYWNIMDPTNGFTAIHSDVLRILPLDKIDNRYFFESDMLFRLNVVRAVVYDFPMESKYADEKSNLNVAQAVMDFPTRYLNRFLKRIFYNYILRDFNPASIQILIGLPLCLWGVIFGSWNWWLSIEDLIIASSGTVMLASLPIILGFQLLLSALQYDMINIPSQPIQGATGQEN